jgi:Pectinesterase
MSHKVLGVSDHREWLRFTTTASTWPVRPSLSPAGWDNWDNPQAEKTAFYAEYHSTGPGFEPAARPSWIRQLIDVEALRYTVSNVIGGSDGWNPEAAFIPTVK